MAKRKVLLLGCLTMVLILAFVVGCPRRDDTGAGQEEQPAGEQVTRGGTLRIITGAGPATLGHPARGGPVEFAARFPGAEPLAAVSDERKMEPVLAESWVEDIDNNTITFKLREGVRFHDGSELTAEVAAWNFNIRREFETLRFREFIEDIEVVDKYTFTIHMNDWNNMILADWGLMQILSMEGYEAKRDELGDEAWEEWTTYNLIGTGPFRLVVYTRDVEMIWERFEDYWREGYPYLDAVHYIYIPDTSTAAAMMEAGEADVWLGAPEDQIDRMVDIGFVRQAGWAGWQWHLMPQTVRPDSPFVDKRVREAAWYAIDRQALADALGYGNWTPLNTVAPPGDWGGDRVFREYNPEKARQLLAEAGFSDGLPIILLAQAGAGGRNTTAEAVAYMLNKAGFEVTIDVADAGRFSGAVWANGWEHLALMFSGQDITYHISKQRWWGHDSRFLHSVLLSEEMLYLSRQALLARTREEQKSKTEQYVYMMAEDALIIPLINNPMAFLHNGRVHTCYTAQGFTRWKFHDMWLEAE